MDGNDPKQLAISQLALSRRIRKLAAAASDSPVKTSENLIPFVSRGVEFRPTASSGFSKDGMLFVFFELFEPQFSESPSTTVAAHLRILDARTNEVKIDFALVDAAPYINPGNPLIPIARGIRLDSLPIGSYRLEVRATDSAGNSTAWRSATFTV